MIALLLMAAAPTAIDAERAFAADAQRRGQWTAFRATAADEALMFTPQPVNAQAFLKGRKDPPASVRWWPGSSVVSCDARTAVNQGPWAGAAGRWGYFTTVWQRGAGGQWKWLYDGGKPSATPLAVPAKVAVRRASCRGRPTGANIIGTVAAVGYRNGGGRSPDGTLAWSWATTPTGERHFLVELWNGKRFTAAIDETIPPE